MTRKHYQIIASGFSNELARLKAEYQTGLNRIDHITGLELAARSVAEELRQTNPRFDRDRFLAACGLL